MSGLGGGSIYCIDIAALHYNSRQQKKGCPAGQPHKNIGTFVGKAYVSNPKPSQMPKEHR